MKIEITKAQLLAVIEITDNIQGMIGCADPDDDGYDFDVEMKKAVKLVDRFLKKNGYKRNFV